MATVEGYGSSLDIDDDHVTIRFGRAGAAASGTKALRLPINEITGISLKDASALVNGNIRFAVTGDPNRYSDPETSRHIDPSMCVVHFRKKDRDAFEAVHADLLGRLAERDTRVLAHTPEGQRKKDGASTSAPLPVGDGEWWLSVGDYNSSMDEDFDPDEFRAQVARARQTRGSLHIDWDDDWPSEFVVTPDLDITLGWDGDDGQSSEERLNGTDVP